MWWMGFLATAFGSCFPRSGASGPLLPPPTEPFSDEARIDGMVARWRVEDDQWVVQLEAETTGWVVFGTNRSDDIVGAELFFGSVVGGVGEVAHHEVLAPGVHRAVRQPRVTLLASAQREGRTAVRLRIPAPVLDEESGTWLVLAWSHEPDLDHHSAVRRHLNVYRSRSPS